MMEDKIIITLCAATIGIMAFALNADEILLKNRFYIFEYTVVIKELPVDASDIRI
ncbi:MAG: hypothetical protein HY589_02240 [Candidatus Omnitrophica bacterium]|nr:hypothetical protein [Candidatus Omnitrophota bacterium]